MKLKKEEMTSEEKHIQKILNKIISEEILASMFYSSCILATCNCKSERFEKLFTEIANDELNDHYSNLKKWAIENGFEIPFKFKDYLKFAEKDYKRIDDLKKDEDPLYYINKAIESEQSAIQSYTEAIDDDVIPYELTAILTYNYYDEIEHLEELSILKYAIEAGADLIEY